MMLFLVTIWCCLPACASTSYFLMGMGLGNPWDWESSNDWGYQRLQKIQKFFKKQKTILTLKQKQWIFSSKSSLNQRSNLEFILLIEQKLSHISLGVKVSYSLDTLHCCFGMWIFSYSSKALTLAEGFLSILLSLIITFFMKIIMYTSNHINNRSSPSAKLGPHYREDINQVFGYTWHNSSSCSHLHVKLVHTKMGGKVKSTYWIN